MAPLFEIRQVSGGYGREDIVTDVSLAVHQGDCVGVIGPNGSGKTTLLRLATRVLRPRTGGVYLKGCDIATLDRKAFCRSVAFVPQDIATDFSFTVMEQVLMGRIPHLKRLQPEGKRDSEIARGALTATDALRLADRSIDELSAGERQRVALAQALAQEPQLLLLDEPTAHLDIGHQVQVLDLLMKLKRNSSLTIIAILHDLNLASAYCNRIVLIDGGRVVKEGAPAEVLTYQTIEQVYKTVVLVEENRLTGKPNIVLVPGERR